MGVRSPIVARAHLLPMLILLIGTIGTTARGQGLDEARPPTSLFDLRLARVRKASVAWEARRGPARQVVDQVVLTSNLAEFYEAIASWDDSHWFPVLLEDAEFTPRFLRAFRPGRVVHFRERGDRSRAGGSWEAAARAVERSWSVREEEAALGLNPPKPGVRPRPVLVPARLGKTPPGLVLAAPESPSLAAAVALAAGRFQPLVPWTRKKTAGGSILNEEEAIALAAEVEAAVAAIAPRHASLGDDCDFLTLAADLPDRYNISGGMRNGHPAAGIAAFDDLLGRDRQTQKRWAFAGRIEGDPVPSIYRSMCSLFLRPQSALFFDAYDPARSGFETFVMRPAATKLELRLATGLVQGEAADLAGWHRAFGRKNTHELVYVNSSGNPTSFNLRGRQGANVADIPASVPAVVLFNHSYSAAEPGDVDTIAGRWLAAGAFIYFGSMNEPYLQAFRTPTLAAELLIEGLPVSAAVRILPEETRTWGIPWRLTFLGDPLYRLERRSTLAARLGEWGDPDAWKPLEIAEKRPLDLGAEGSLEWSRKATLLEAARGEDRALRKAMEDALLSINRQNLRASLRPLYDSLMIDALFQPSPRAGEIQARLAEIGPLDRSAAVARALETARAYEAAVDPRRR